MVVPSLIPFPVALKAKPSGIPSEATPPLLPSSAPPAKIMFPPPANPLTVEPLAVLMVPLSPRVMAPLPLASESAQKITSPPAVVMVLLAFWVIFPVAFKRMSPFAVPADVLMLPFTVILPPKTVIGPAMVVSELRVMSLAFALWYPPVRVVPFHVPSSNPVV